MSEVLDWREMMFTPRGIICLQTFHNSSFDPQTLVLLAFDEAWLTLKSVGKEP